MAKYFDRQKKKLERRQKSYDEMTKKMSNPSSFHRPGSMNPKKGQSKIEDCIKMNSASKSISSQQDLVMEYLEVNFEKFKYTFDPIKEWDWLTDLAKQIEKRRISNSLKF